MRLCKTSETKDGSPCFLLFGLHPCLVSQGKRPQSRSHDPGAWPPAQRSLQIRFPWPNCSKHSSLLSESCRRNIWNRSLSLGNKAESTKVNTRLRRRWPRTRARELHRSEQQPGKLKLHRTSQNATEIFHKQSVGSHQHLNLQGCSSWTRCFSFTSLMLHWNLKSNPRTLVPSWFKANYCSGAT